MNEDVTYVVKCIPPLPKEKKEKKRKLWIGWLIVYMNGMGIWMSNLKVEDQIWINSLMKLGKRKINQQKEKVSMRECLVGIMLGLPHAMWCEAHLHPYWLYGGHVPNISK